MDALVFVTNPRANVCNGLIRIRHRTRFDPSKDLSGLKEYGVHISRFDPGGDGPSHRSDFGHSRPNAANY